MTTTPLPALTLSPHLGILTRWLRLAGFAARPDQALAEPVPGTDGVRYHRAVASPSAGPPRDLLVAEGDWRAQLATLAAALELHFDDLSFLHVCCSCGGTMAPAPAARQGARPTVVCEDCGRAAWNGPALRAHVRQLRDVFLEHLFRCSRCAVEGEEAKGRNLLRLEILANPGPVVLREEDLAGDLDVEIAQLLRRIERMSVRQLTDGVAFTRQRFLCNPCKRELSETLDTFFDGEASV